jgi:hypothetical protein
LRVRTLDKVIRNAEAPRFARCVLRAALNFTSIEELTSFSKAEKVTIWKAAMGEEMEAIEATKTWEFTSLPVA